MSRRNGIITLTSDFGTRDVYVGAMKGVICSILPTARIIDITHEIPPQKILEGALLLEGAYPWFPPGTVNVVVIDPAVGTQRRALAVEARGQFFVGPDNGVLSAPLGEKDARAISIIDPAYEMPQRSDTFHGRDVFAPAAAHIASGVDIDRFGPRVSDCVMLALPRPEVDGAEIRGEILRIDRFGNAQTNIPRSLLAGGEQAILAKGRDFGPLRRRYEDVPAGGALALTGADGRIEISVNGGHAAERLGLAPGDEVLIRPI